MQLYAMMLSLRLLECVCSKEVYCPNMAVGVGISIVVQGLLVWAVYRLKGVVSLGIKPIRWLYVGYLTWYSVVTLGRVVSLDGVLPSGIRPWLGFAVMLLACIYCAKLGFKPLMRSSVVVGFIVVVALGVVLFGLVPSVEVSNVYANGGSILHYAVNDLLHSVDLVFLPLLVGVSYPRGDAFKYLGIKLISLEVLTLVGVGVLGGVSVVSQYPLIELATYSQPFGTQRCDAIYTAITTLMCVLNVSVAIRLALHKDTFKG